jgi:hypothetical protein
MMWICTFPYWTGQQKTNKFSSVLVLSHEEFTQLNVDYIRDFAIQLEQILDAISSNTGDDNNNRNDLPYDSGYPAWSLSPDMRNNQRDRMLVKESNLDQLETLAQVLTATLSPGSF